MGDQCPNEDRVRRAAQVQGECRAAIDAVPKPACRRRRIFTRLRIREVGWVGSAAQCALDQMRRLAKYSSTVVMSR
jgi:hypothetical protein